MKDLETVLLAHGAGGRLTGELVRDLFLPALRNPQLEALSDAAVLPELDEGRPALTTDAFVVEPHVFPGGDLGELSITGTVNDLAVAGARPLWLTWALILEEGAPGDLITTCVEGARRAAEASGIRVVAGDTKVVPRGKGDLIFAVTSGLGVIPPGRDLGDHRIEPGDELVVTGPVGDHGATIMAARHGMDPGGLVSDCAPLNVLLEPLLRAGLPVKAMHDPTRGGVVTVCHEVAERAGVSIELDGGGLPVRPAAEAVCQLLGLDPLYLACEGRALIWTEQGSAQAVVEHLRRHELGREAAAIGSVVPRDRHGAPVVLETGYGVARPLDLLSGAELPRIC